ncbi:capsular polysaccharide export protein, LipB/KpsS family [Anaerosporobacter faecicola]|uniref:capsular polysaccharide export protein, LipB/KpsS family n=1 Tax=Anaerosporobacter faecicola TaxID=2718714 RepID=UPI00143C8F77|nr:hypothetical protein [Anaerosporobacter faecicola]
MKTIEDYLSIEAIKLKEKINKRKIVIFGAGTRIEKIFEIWDFSNDVLFYVDNDKNKWGQTIRGKNIQSPLTLQEVDTQNTVVLIASPYRDSIINQINKMSIQLEIIDICQLFELDFWLSLHFDSSKKYLSFLEKNKEEIKNSIIERTKRVDKNQEIGIVIVPAFPTSYCYYSITIMLILLSKGYKATLIIDDLVGTEDYTLYEGASKMYNSITKEVLDYLFSIVKIPVLYISDAGKVKDINEEEKIKIESIANTSAQWLLSVKSFKIREKGVDEVALAFKKILIENMKYVKSFFEKYKFDTINIYTGIYNNMGLYSIVSEEKNIRMSSYDSNGRKNGKIFFCKKGIFGQLPEMYDILTNKEKMIDKKLYNELCKYGKKRIEQSQNSTMEAGSMFYQSTKDDNFNEKIDILMPMNIEWDSSACSVCSVFKSMENWLIETLQFILSNTNETIMVREHPRKAQLDKMYNFINIKEILETKFENNPRIIFIKAEDKINTYKQIKNCKIVLPYTSTVGLEAAIMNKKVVLATEVYYRGIKGIKYTDSKEEYFNTILSEIKSDRTDEEVSEDLYLAIALHDYLGINTDFSECLTEWTESHFSELKELEVTDCIVNTVAENQSYVLQNIKRNFKYI